MSNDKQIEKQIVWESDRIRVVAKPSRDFEGGLDYHTYALDRDDFGGEYWKWTGKSGLDNQGKCFATVSKR